MLFADSSLSSFEKYHGLGNDVILVDGLTVASPLLPEGKLQERILVAADRRTGIGFDQVMLMLPPVEGSGCDAKIRIFNGSDGSEAEACGNGTRCVVSYLSSKLSKSKISLDAPAGILRGEVFGALGGEDVQVEQGVARMMQEEAIDLEDMGMKNVFGYGVDIGNPHLVIFLPGQIPLKPDLVSQFGSALEHHPLFKNRTNVEFCAADLKNNEVSVLMWERGAGRTRACGSGACAVAFAAIIKLNMSSEKVTIKMEGGNVILSLSAEGIIKQRAEAKHVYSGRLNIIN